MIRSLGDSNTRCRAIVSSTTPRFGPRWPPVFETDWTRNARIACASWTRARCPSRRRAAGPRIWSRTPMGSPLVARQCNPGAVVKSPTVGRNRPADVTETHPPVRPPSTPRPTRAPPEGAASGVDERAQHVLQDPAVAVVVGLAGGVDPQDRIEGDHRAVAANGAYRDGRRRRAVVECGHSGDRHGLGPVS